MAKKKLRVGVLFGGRSGEHEVSLLSAASILKAMDRKKYDVVPLGITRQGHWLGGEEAHALLSGTYSTAVQLDANAGLSTELMADSASLPRSRLVAAMVGREQVAAQKARREAQGVQDGQHKADAAVALAVEGLSWRHRVRDVSLTVRRGEIVGLAGLLGSGRTETFKTIYGAEKPDRGTVSVAGRRIGNPRPSESIRRGLAFLSEDRRSEGVFAQLSVAENLTAAVLPRISRFGVISRRRRDDMVRRYVQSLGVKAAGPDAPITSLSGGNQQKVLIARALCTEPDMVMLDDPTRGIDVGAKAEVHRVVRGLAAEGLGVLVTSSELEEVVELSDRLVVLDEGRVTGGLDTAGRDSDDVLALLAGGAAADAPAH